MALLRKLSNFFRFTPQTPPEKLGSSYFYAINGGSSTFTDSKAIDDFIDLPEVNAIVNIKARAFSKMNVQVVSKETGLPPKNYEDMVKLWQSPNYFQSIKEFLRQTKIFREISGNEYIYMNFPAGFSILSTKAMFTLPPTNVEPITDSKMPFFLQLDPKIVYKYTWGNDHYMLDKANVIHLNDNRVRMTPDNWVQGESWMSACKPLRNNIRNAYASRGVIIERRGALGILKNANKDIAGKVPMTLEEKQDVQNQWRMYGALKDQWQVITTNLDLEWVQISTDPDKLGLYQEVEEDRIALCNAAGVPSDLLPGIKGVTYENQKWSERRMYEATIIPDAQEWVDAMNAAFETEKKSWMIVGSFDQLNIFAENRKERAQSIQLVTGGLSRAFLDGAITIDQYRDELDAMGVARASEY